MFRARAAMSSSSSAWRPSDRRQRCRTESLRASPVFRSEGATSLCEQKRLMLVSSLRCDSQREQVCLRRSYSVFVPQQTTGKWRNMTRAVCVNTYGLWYSTGHKTLAREPPSPGLCGRRRPAPITESLSRTLAKRRSENPRKRLPVRAGRRWSQTSGFGTAPLNPMKPRQRRTSRRCVGPRPLYWRLIQCACRFLGCWAHSR